MGQARHHSRPVKGIMTMIRSAHHTIQVKMMPKFLLPTEVPKRPVMITRTKKKRVKSIKVG